LVGITVLTKTALRAYESVTPIEKRGYRLSSAGSTPRPFLRRPKNMPIQSPSERPKKYGPTLSKMSGWEISSPFTAKRATQNYQKFRSSTRNSTPKRLSSLGCGPSDARVSFHCEFCSVQNFLEKLIGSGHLGCGRRGAPLTSSVDDVQRR